MNEDELKELIRNMIDEVDERSGEGELDRHDCQYVAEKYMRIIFNKMTPNP